MTNDELLHKWVEQTITSEELAVFKKRPEYESLTQLYAQTAELEPPSFDMESMLSDILSTKKPGVADKSHATATERRLVGNGRRQWMRLAIAACVLLIPAYFLFVTQGTGQANIQEELLAGQVKEGTLPDLSSYTLTGPATLAYKEEKDGTRKVNLEGQATFKVQKGAPFIVATPTGIVKVIGTAFEVISADGELKVACTHGKVSVSSLSKGTYKEVLVANESMRLYKDGSSVTWKTKNTKLKNVELAIVLDELAKKYTLNFDSGNIALSDKLSCNFANDNLDLALKTTLSPAGVKYSQSNNTVTLTK